MYGVRVILLSTLVTEGVASVLLYYSTVEFLH